MTDDITTSSSAEENTAEREPLTGNVKVTREDWLNAALNLLVSEGVDRVKILTIGTRLGVSRSSFYWYFESRKDLLDALLDHWQATNTRSILTQCGLPSETITEGVCNLFRCFVDESTFSARLDAAVRDWSRRSQSVRRVVDRADADRLAAIETMFRRHGFAPDESATRARIVYYMQIGYYAMELNETIEERLDRVPGYLFGFTGVAPRQSEIDALADYARSVAAA